ncbi:MAG: agmatine deiminase family protein [Microscillaceae bacterium]|jgi:agmatine deiminase|nr:agmatine deiminase family protein [Microscillaceae bacterium]
MKSIFSKFYYFLWCGLVFLWACNTQPSQEQKKPDETAFFMPAEYEAQEAVWLGWEEYAPYHQPFLDLAKALYPYIKLKIIVENDASKLNLQQKLRQMGLDTQKITFYTLKDNRLWMRDHGATYIINRKGEKKVVDFGWTMYGYEEYLQTYYEGNADSVRINYKRSLGATGLIDSLMGARENHLSIKTQVNMEGGSIEVNGKGTLILCEKVTMQRNPKLDKNTLENEFKKALGVSNIIWLKKGLVEDPFYTNQIFGKYFGMGTYGHTDEFVRFVNDTTLLLAWVDEKEKHLNAFNYINYERMSENLAILQNARDQNGKPFTIIKVPLPDLLYLKTTVTEQSLPFSPQKIEKTAWKMPQRWLPKRDILAVGDSLYWVAASSYLNYLVTNEAVILPSYLAEGSSAQKEAQVKAIFSRVFPSRKLIFIDAINLNYHGGGIHCITQQEPKSRLAR